MAEKKFTLQLLRNETSVSSRELALRKIKDIAADLKAGEPAIVTYKGKEEGAIEEVILAIKGQEHVQIFEGAILKEDGTVALPDEVVSAIDEINKAIEDEEAARKDADKAIEDEIAALVTELTTKNPENAPENAVVKSIVKNAEGEIEVNYVVLTAGDVAATAIEGDADSVAVAGTTVAAQIADIAKTLKGVKDNAAKYEVVKLTADEITTLSDASNIKEAYKVVSYVGEGEKTQVGDTIKIYKDATLKAVAPKEGNPQVIVFTHTLADGEDTTTEIDLGKAIFESEIGNGLAVSESGVISVKVDAASEKFGEGENAVAALTVSADGLKLAGVQDAIDATVAAEIAKLDVEDTAEEGKFVTAVSEADGKITVTRDGVNAKNVALETVKENVEDGIALAATNVQDFAQEIFDKVIEDEKVTANAVKAVTDVLGGAAMSDEEVKYNAEVHKADEILKAATSFTDADSKLSTAIKAVDKRIDDFKEIDCGTY